MPKYKDFFTKLKTDGKISIPEFDEYLKTVPDADIPDAVVRAIENTFMTFDRASAHPDIHKKIKREALDPVDNEMGDIVEMLKEYLDETKFKDDPTTGPKTYNKIRSLKDSIPDILKKVKGTPVTDEETKKELAESKKTIQEFSDKFTKAEKDYKTQLQKFHDDQAAKFDDYKLHTELEKMGNKYTLAEPFEETRGAITEINLTKIKQSNSLKLGEKDGRPVIIVNDEHGKPKFQPNSNTPVTIDSLLDEAYKPFLKKSEGGNGQTQVNTKTTTKVEPVKTTIRRGVSTTVANTK